MEWKLTTAPAELAVSLANMKLHLKADSSEEDDYITTLIKACTENCEYYTQTRFVNQTYTITLDKFESGYIELPIGNLSSITSIQYYDGDNSLQTWSSSDYIVDTNSKLPRISPANNSYPSTYDRINAVVITAVFGYGADDTSVPEIVQSAIKLQVRDLYDNPDDPVREKNVASMMLLNKIRVYP
jgi:uncharacterized phiE125 gp8 family phage protein